MKALIVTFAPVVIILFYVYFRDKYEKEPLGLLLFSLLAGAVIVIPIIIAERFIMSLKPPLSQLGDAAYTAFLVAGLVEEAFKFLALYLLIWKNPNFNEKFDGIVYAVFISLGFAAVENFRYVADGGLNTAYIRALTAVPVHALLGVRMGYYFGISHMYPELRKRFLALSFIVPLLLHGLYDFLIMSGMSIFLLLFFPYLVYLYFQGFKKMKLISDSSIFREDEEVLR